MLGSVVLLYNYTIVQSLCASPVIGRRIFWLELDGNSFRIKLGLSMRKKVVYCDSGYLKIKSCIQSGWIDSGCKRENVRGAFGLKKRRNLQFCYRSPGCFLDSFKSSPRNPSVFLSERSFCLRKVWLFHFCFDHLLTKVTCFWLICGKMICYWWTFWRVLSFCEKIL